MHPGLSHWLLCTTCHWWYLPKVYCRHVLQAVGTCSCSAAGPLCPPHRLVPSACTGCRLIRIPSVQSRLLRLPLKLPPLKKTLATQTMLARCCGPFPAAPAVFCIRPAPKGQPAGFRRSAQPWRRPLHCPPKTPVAALPGTDPGSSLPLDAQARTQLPSWLTVAGFLATEGLRRTGLMRCARAGWYPTLLVTT